MEEIFPQIETAMQGYLDDESSIPAEFFNTNPGAEICGCLFWTTRHFPSRIVVSVESGIY